MATAKAKAKVSDVKEDVQIAETNVEVKIEEGKMYKFVSNGNCATMPKNKEYLLTAELYQLFIKKGYGE